LRGIASSRGFFAENQSVPAAAYSNYAKVSKDTFSLVTPGLLHRAFLEQVAAVPSQPNGK